MEKRIFHHPNHQYNDKEFNQDGAKAFPGKEHSKEEEWRQLQRENQRLKETVEVLRE